jgi:hypothetical protein
MRFWSLLASAAGAARTISDMLAIVAYGLNLGG